MGHSHDRRGRSPRAPEDTTASSTVPSPGSWDVPRGRSRVRRPENPLSEDNLAKRGYHALLTPFGKVFHVEQRWKLIREMGSGAYGVVISALDEISGETVAIKQVTRVLDKVPLAKRALREITLLRHFANHENITGLIDLDAISPDFNEIYIFLEPMEADLHQIIKSGQALTTEHVQYFLYQLLRGMKYIHSAGVVHRDLKPGNLLVNADCELKICDFGLSRGFDAPRDGMPGTQMTEYVATRWYRAPEIMLAFTRYDTAIDIWSIGCIFAELMTGKTLFKGKDYIDQLNKILEGIGTPDEDVITRIGSDKAQAYVRSLPHSKGVPLEKTVPMADADALGLLRQMLAFDPAQRLSVTDALAHAWLAAYHDAADEPACAVPFTRWRELEALETIDEYRAALWAEIQDYRAEARRAGAGTEPEEPEPLRVPTVPEDAEAEEEAVAAEEAAAAEKTADAEEATAETDTVPFPADEPPPPAEAAPEADATPGEPHGLADVAEEPGVDPVISYARRSSFLRSHTYATYTPSNTRGHKPLPSWDGMPRAPATHVYAHAHSASVPAAPAAAAGGVPFPSSDESYVFPARNRTMSVLGGDGARKLLRTLSTLSIHETGEGLPGGLAAVAPYLRELPTADMPFSEMPDDLAPDWPTRKPPAAAAGPADNKTPVKKKTFHIF